MDSKCWWNRDFEARSRNWEDEEIELKDEIYGNSVSDLIFAWSVDMRKGLNGQKLCTEQLFIACGPCSSIFLDLQFKEKILIGSITFPLIAQSQNSVRSSVNNKTCLIYQANPNLVLVLCQYLEESVDAENLYWWTHELFHHIEAKNVLVLDCITDRKIALTENVNPETLVLPQLRYLATNVEITSFSKLEPPLLVKHFAASILTHCQINKIASVLLMSLSNNNFIGGETLKGFELASGTFATQFQVLSEGAYENELGKFKARAKNPLYI